MTKFEFIIGETDESERFDDFLSTQIGAVSKMFLRNQLEKGVGSVNGESQKGGYHLKKGDFVEIEIDLSAETAMKPEAFPLEIIFEDEEILVVNKPAEMLVHPTRSVKSGTLQNALAFHLNRENLETLNDPDDGEKKIETNFTDHSKIQNLTPKFARPGLVHRLDKKTSGLMVIAKTERSHRILSNHFERKLVEKKYIAVVEGVVEKDFGVIEAPIGRDENLKQWRVLENGKQAETRFRVIEKRKETTLLELQPITGRTNQLRIHCAFFGHPIVGDTERGGRECFRLCLHAYQLKFWHPNGNKRVEFETKLPKEMINKHE